MKAETYRQIQEEVRECLKPGATLDLMLGHAIFEEVARRCPTVKARGLASHEARQLIGLIAATMPEYLQALDAMKEHDHYIEKLTQSLQGLTKKTPARHEIVAGPDDEGWGG